MAKKKNPAEVESIFDGGQTLDSIVGGLFKGGRGIGDLLILAGQAIKAFTPRSSTEGLDQKDKPVQVLLYEAQLNGGTQDWVLKVDENSVRFQVDHSLGTKTQGHLFLLTMEGRKKLEYGGSGERKVIDVLKRWLNQFFSEIEQAAISEDPGPKTSGAQAEESPYPSAAIAAVKLIESLQARQKKGKS